MNNFMKTRLNSQLLYSTSNSVKPYIQNEFDQRYFYLINIMENINMTDKHILGYLFKIICCDIINTLF